MRVFLSLLILLLAPLGVRADDFWDAGPYHGAVGSLLRLELATNAQTIDGYFGLSAVVGRRWFETHAMVSLEYQEFYRREAGNPTVSVSSMDREVFLFVDHSIEPFSGGSFRTALGAGAGALFSSVSTRFQNTVVNSYGSGDLLFKLGLSLQYVLYKGFQLSLDGRLHYAKGVSDRIMPEALLRLGYRF